MSYSTASTTCCLSAETQSIYHYTVFHPTFRRPLYITSMARWKQLAG
jgi:hypothetical protein